MRTVWMLVAAGVAAASALSGCKSSTDSSKTKGTPPAKVEKLPVETEISRITLTGQAEQRLGITLAVVAKADVERRRTFGGDVTIPAGKSIIVSAPLPGAITAPAAGSIPLPGQMLRVGDPVMTLVPLLSPERDVPTPAERVLMANARATVMSALTVAHGDVDRGAAEVEAAQIALDRAAKLLADKAGSRKAVDDAQAQMNVAQSLLAAAQQREQQFERLVADLDAKGTNGQAAPFSLTSPQSGVLRSLLVTRGQTVTAGAALFEVADTSRMWVRVPIYVELETEIDTDHDANIVGLDGRAAFRPRQARPVAAPPTADPLSTTADLYFEVDNADGSLRPGQRVGVELTLRGPQQAPVVPAKAILYDIYGGTWVYVKTDEHAFQRHRVLIRYTDNDRAVLAEAPPEGSQVVVAGAAELYGTEFGSGK